MDNNSTLVMIPVDKIYPHPDNPRKDLGDISELIESIKSRGIMQNLTVIPCGYNADDKYIVVIGHRRLAAAKRAGLKEVPCVVTHMTEKETLATMLLENMQRSDLTVYEQAQGFQMMIDLGERVSDIAEKTGFSEATVRRRVRITKLDQATLKKVSGRQITFGDLDKLFDVESEQKRNELLKDIGTNNFNNRLKNVIVDEKNKRDEKAAREMLAKKGLTEIRWEERYGGKYEQIGHFYTPAKEIDVDDIIAKGGTHYNFGYGAFYLYKPADQAKKAEQDEARRRADKINERRKALTDAYGRAYELRREFMREHLPTGYNMVKALTLFIRYAATHSISDLDAELACEILDVKIEAKEGENREDAIIRCLCEFADSGLRAHARSFAALIYLLIEDRKGDTLFDYYSLEYDDDPEENIHYIYAFLEILGYEISDEEQQLLDGSHPLYNKE